MSEENTSSSTGGETEAERKERERKEKEKEKREKEQEEVDEIQHELDAYNGLKFDSSGSWWSYIWGKQNWTTFDCEWEVEGSHHAMTIGLQSDFVLGGVNKAIFVGKTEFNIGFASTFTLGAAITIELGFKYEWTKFLKKEGPHEVHLDGLKTSITDLEEEANGEHLQLDEIQNLLAEVRDDAIGEMEDTVAERMEAMDEKSDLIIVDGQLAGEYIEAYGDQTVVLGAEITELGEKIELAEEKERAVGAAISEVGTVLEASLSKEITTLLHDATPGVELTSGIVIKI